LGRANVVVPFPPYLVPSKENSAWLLLMGRTRPSAGRVPTEAVDPAVRMIWPSVQVAPPLPVVALLVLLPNKAAVPAGPCGPLGPAVFQDRAFVLFGHVLPAFSRMLSAPVLVFTQPWMVVAVTVGAIDAAAVAPPDKSSAAPTISAAVRRWGYRLARRAAWMSGPVIFISLASLGGVNSAVRP
jgi:hypothetical protein